MISIDTNILVRVYVKDDKEQTAYSAELIENHPIFIAKSVLLETEWVLRFTYELEAPTILDAFEKILGMPNVTVEDPACILRALQLYRHGLDFADAMHFSSSSHVSQFATLDKKFVKLSKKLNIHLLTMT